MVILDTCGIIELYKSAPKLKTKTLEYINNNKVYVLSISFAEIACKIKTKKLEIGITIEELFKDFLAVPNIVIVNIDVELWLNAINLNWPDNKDPVDRLIISFAIKNKLLIVTSNTKIKRFYKKVLW
jgi:PIN domain nuclease of toxin-antitoxin system